MNGIRYNNKSINKNPLISLTLDIGNQKYERLEKNKLDNSENDIFKFCVKNKLDYKSMKEINDKVKNIIDKRKISNNNIKIKNNNNQFTLIKVGRCKNYKDTKNINNFSHNNFNSFCVNNSNNNKNNSYSNFEIYNNINRLFSPNISNYDVKNKIRLSKIHYKNSVFNNKNELFNSSKLFNSENIKNFNKRINNNIISNFKKGNKNNDKKENYINKNKFPTSKIQKKNKNYINQNLNILNQINSNYYNEEEKEYNTTDISDSNKNELYYKKKVNNSNRNYIRQKNRNNNIYDYQTHYNIKNKMKMNTSELNSLLSKNFCNSKNINNFNMYNSKSNNFVKQNLNLGKPIKKFFTIRGSIETENTKENILSQKLNNSSYIHNLNIKNNFFNYSQKNFIDKNDKLRNINIKKKIENKSDKFQYHKFIIGSKEGGVKREINIYKIKKDSLSTNSQSKTKNISRFEKLYNDRIEYEENFQKLKKQDEEKYSYKPKINKCSSFFKINKPFNERLKTYNNKTKERFLKIKIENDKKRSVDETFMPKINTVKNKKLIKEEDFKNKNINTSYNSQNNLYNKLYSYKAKFDVNLKRLSDKIYETEIQEYPKLCSKTNDIINQKKVKIFRKIFRLLDIDEDNKISGYNINDKILPIKIQKILEPIFKELKSEREALNEFEFIYICQKYYNSLNYIDKREIMNFEDIKKINKKRRLLIQNKNSYSFRPKINRCITEMDGNIYPQFLTINNNLRYSNDNNKLYEIKNKRTRSLEVNQNILFSSKYNSKNKLNNNNKKEKLFSGVLRNNNISFPNIIYNNSSSKGFNTDLFMSGCRINKTPKNNNINFGFDFSNISRTSNTNYIPLKIIYKEGKFN